MKAALGILGGGQLALYLCEAAARLGVPVTIFSDNADDVALPKADKSLVGDLDNARAVEWLVANSGVITFDKEAIPSQTLSYLAQAQKQGRVWIRPDADILTMLKDKALQKTWLEQQKFPTLPFFILNGTDSAAQIAEHNFGDALVQKSRSGGYDGRGVQMVKSSEPALALWDVPSIVEPFLSDCREISVITVRASSGELQTYPPVDMDFDSQLNSVRTVSMPANISFDIKAQSIALAEQVVTRLNGVGVFAIEMFITPEDKLLINEISPRVHNSGHITMDACNVSQFEQHVRAVTGMPLVEIEEQTPATMHNILYQGDLRSSCPEVPVTDKTSYPGLSIYWYGKATGRVGRKMGHINAVASSAATADELARSAVMELSSSTREQSA